MARTEECILYRNFDNGESTGHNDITDEQL